MAKSENIGRKNEPGEERHPEKLNLESGGRLPDPPHEKDQRPDEGAEVRQDVVAVDARGLLCPEPVLLTTRALAQIPPGKAGTLHVLVNTAAAKENVSRLAESKGCRVTAKAAGEDVLLIIQKP